MRQHLDRTPGLTATAWAKKSGVSESGFRDFMKGRVKSITIDLLAKLASAENLTLSAFWRDGVPVVGRVGAGAEVFPFDDHPKGCGLYEIDAPPGCPLDAVAVEVEGESMYPDYWPGDVLIYRRDAPFYRDACLYQDCVVRILDGPTLVKRVKPGAHGGVVTLESSNAPPRLDVVLEWGAPVLFHDKSRRRVGP